MTSNSLVPIAMPITFISAYAFPAARQRSDDLTLADTAARLEQDRDAFYDLLQTVYQKYAARGPTHIGGDMNARICQCRTVEEARVVGKFAFDLVRAKSRHQQSPAVLENRQQLIDFCSNNELYLANTCFQKPDNKLATYRDEKRSHPQYWEPIRENFDQIDFW